MESMGWNIASFLMGVFLCLGLVAQVYHDTLEEKAIEHRCGYYTSDKKFHWGKQEPAEHE